MVYHMFTKLCIIVHSQFCSMYIQKWIVSIQNNMIFITNSVKPEKFGPVIFKLLDVTRTMYKRGSAFPTNYS